VYSSVLSIGLLFFAWATAGWAVLWFGPRWGISELHDVASMPLLLAMLIVAGFISDPASNTFGRLVEHEADVFALEVTHLNDAGARAYIKLGSQNKSNPEPPGIVKIFQYTHPPLIERIRFAQSYRPWEEGKPNRFYHPRYASVREQSFVEKR